MSRHRGRQRLYGEKHRTVNIRFKVANTLRLENDTNATTKGNPNTLVLSWCPKTAFPAAETMAAAAETTVKRRTRWDKGILRTDNRDLFIYNLKTKEYE